MLKIKDDVRIDDFDLFTSYGFKPSDYCGDRAWEKEFRKGLFYKEYLIIWWKDKEIQIRNNGQVILNTLYDLIQARASRKSLADTAVRRKK